MPLLKPIDGIGDAINTAFHMIKIGGMLVLSHDIGDEISVAIVNILAFLRRCFCGGDKPGG